MNISKYAMIALLLVLSACNSMPQKKPSDAALEGVGLYKVNLEQADQLYVQKEYQKALVAYQKLHEIEAKDTHVLFRIANTYSHLAVPKLAIRYYELALKEDIHMAKAWYNLGVLHMKAGASTWTQMSKYVDHDDPLFKSSKRYSRGMLELIRPVNP